MSAWIGPAVVVVMIAGCITFAAWEVGNMRRSRRWVRTPALVCANAQDLALKPSRQPPGGLTVMFEGPAGPCVAPLAYSHARLRQGLAIGTTIPVIYNPENPMQVEGWYEAEEHGLRLAFLGFCLLMLLVGLWRMLTME